MPRLSQKFPTLAGYMRELERITKRWDNDTRNGTGSLVLSREDLPDGYKRQPYNLPRAR